VAAVLLVCCIGGIAVVANGGKNTSNTANTSNTSSPVATSPSGVTPTTAPTTSDHKIGDTVNFNSEWQVTITSATLSNGDASQFDPTPDAGKTYLIIEGSFKNLTTKAQPLSTLLYFELRDAQGNKYDETLLLSITPPDSGGIPAGGLSRGKWPYEVPTSVHAFTLAFDSDLAGNPAIWDINV
jgi:hypothetical protein